jgi:type VI secretion system secreted protein Hcp
MSIRKAGEKPLEYLKITMAQVIITSVSEGGTGSDERLMESVTMNFAKVKVDYKVQSKTGGAAKPLNYSWDVAGNCPW